MRPARRLLATLLIAAAPLAAGAVESDPLPVPQAGAKANAVRLYNDGVALLVSRRFADAQQRFEAALSLDDGLAEAHNNLAFALRMQGPQNFQRSLQHYDQAIRLKPTLAQAYLYRGMLFLQQGERDKAGQDLERLRRLDPSFAEELQRAMEGRPAGARAGITPQY